ncbi:hypothetical protein P9X10_02455 [Bacillus cereus]|nr:hypothetical protein [Bacillus cereus]
MLFTSVNVLIFLTVATVLVYFYYGYKARKQGNSREEMFGFFIGILITIVSALALMDMNKLLNSEEQLAFVVVIGFFLGLTLLNLFMRYQWHMRGLREYRLPLFLGRFIIVACIICMVYQTHSFWVHKV